MKTAELREKTTAQLHNELEALRREQFNLRMQRGAGHAARTHLFREVRRNIARVKTILKQNSDQEGGNQ